MRPADRVEFVGVLESGPDGRRYRFPDLPGFTLPWGPGGGIEEEIHHLELLKSHLDDLRRTGLPVPAPSPVQEVMANPENRRGHHLFRLTDLERLRRVQREFEEAIDALDKFDRAHIHRYVSGFGEKFLLWEHQFEERPRLSWLQSLFGTSPADLMGDCFPIDDRKARQLEPYLGIELDTDQYDYFLEAHDKIDAGPTGP